MYGIALVGDKDEDAVLDEFGISLHTLAGIDVANTMKLQVVIARVSLMAFVDIGSMHTFIRDSVARWIDLPISPRTGLSVKVANGNQAERGRLHQLGGLHRQLGVPHQLLRPSTARFDLVLGVHWLHILGPILWNLEALTMAFWRHGHTVCWTGIGGVSLRCVSLTSTRGLMDVLLASFADLFEEPCGLPPPRRHDHHIHL